MRQKSSEREFNATVSVRKHGAYSSRGAEARVSAHLGTALFSRDASASSEATCESSAEAPEGI